MSAETKTPLEQLQGVRPTVVDRLISWWNPAAGLRRLRARAGLAVMGSYVGGRSDRRSLRRWSTSSGSANADTLFEQSTLRDRSRDLIRNAPLAAGAHSTAVTHVIGTGLELRAHVDRDLLDLSEEEADEWERQAERIWRAWSRTTHCDLTRIQTFAGLQDLAFRSMLESGDILVVRRFAERRGDVLGLKIQLIEADRLTNPDSRFDDERLAGGVEVDGNGAPLAYHVLNHHPGELFTFATPRWTRVPARGRASSDLVSFLLYRRLRPGQLRGVPFLAPVIEPLKSLDRYSEAEVAAAVVNSLMTVFLKTEAEQSVAQLEGTGDASQGLGSDEINLGSGSVVGLMPGEDIAIVEPKRPNSQFEAFMLAVYRQIGVGLDIPFEVLIKHFQSSYSAARAALLEAWKSWKTRRGWFASGYCQPIYEWALSESVARGMLEAPGFDDPAIRAAWTGSEWIGPAPGHIDPLREAQAAEKRIEIGISTVEREAAEASGSNWEELHRQRVKERRMRVDAGLEENTEDGAAAADEEMGDASADARDREEVAA